MNKSKLLLLLGLLVAVVVFFMLDLGRFFSLDYIKGAQSDFAAL